MPGLRFQSLVNLVSMLLFVWTNKGKKIFLAPWGETLPPRSLRGTSCRSNLGVYWHLLFVWLKPRKVNHSLPLGRELR